MLSTAILTDLPLESGENLHDAEVRAFCMPLNQMPHGRHQALPAQAVLGMNGGICGNGDILIPLGVESVMTSLNNPM